MKLGGERRRTQQSNGVNRIIEDRLAVVNAELGAYDQKSAELLFKFRQGLLDPFTYDEEQSGYDQAYQGSINKRNRILARRDRMSSRMAKAVLK